MLEGKPQEVLRLESRSLYITKLYRYIAGCHGERVNQIHSKRAKKMTTRLLKLYRENLNS